MNALAPLLALGLSFASPMLAQGVRLLRVPDVVRLPAAPGTNLMLEAEVGDAASVWLGTDLSSRDRVPLASSGANRWQLNLADARIASMLPAGRDGGELFVFADVGGATKQSTAIGWARSNAGDGRVRCLVRTKKGTSTFVESDSSAWLDVASLERIELQGAGGRQTAAVARLGETELPLVRRAGTDTWVLEGDKTFRERAREATALEVEARLGGASALFQFALVPGTLELPDGGAEFVIMQRKRAAVPGSNGWLRVHVGDITMGSAPVHVTTADGQTLVAEQLLRQRDFVELSLAGERYVLVVEQLVNLLVGDDRAVFRVRPAAGFKPDPIGLLLKLVAASGDTFVREGQQYGGAAAAQFLTAKLGSHRGPEITLDEFIDTLASKSSTTGKPYEVLTQDGATVTMQQWLRTALREIETPKPPAKD